MVTHSSVVDYSRNFVSKNVFYLVITTVTMLSIPQILVTMYQHLCAHFFLGVRKVYLATQAPLMIGKICVSPSSCSSTVTRIDRGLSSVNK